jgi:hypothetical protein
MFKFTIREAILMTTIVAVLLMWWIERNQNAKNHARLTAIETRLQVLPMPAPPTPMAVTSTVMPAGATVSPPQVAANAAPTKSTRRRYKPPSYPYQGPVRVPPWTIIESGP